MMGAGGTRKQEQGESNLLQLEAENRQNHITVDF